MNNYIQRDSTLSLCFNVKTTNEGGSHDVVGDKGLEPLTYPV